MGTVRTYKSIARNLRMFHFFVDDDDVDKGFLRVTRPLPNYRSKGFWISRVEANRYVGTFLQVGYHIPDPGEIEPFCVDALHHNRFRNMGFPKSLVTKYSLRMIRGAEYWKVIR